MPNQAEAYPENVALVTGAASGLGAALARVFAGAGWAVAALDRDGAAVERLAADMPNVLPLPCDLADAAAIEHVVAQTRERFGRVDLLVNAAGIDHTLWLEQFTLAQFDQVIAVNLRAPFLLAQAVWPLMKAQGGGWIVKIASTAALRVWTGASAYHASKFGLVGLSRALNLEGRQDNIRVMTVVPGGMNTGFFERFKAQGIPLPDPAGLQDPADVAAAILHAVNLPPSSVVHELVIAPPNEPSWP